MQYQSDTRSAESPIYNAFFIAFNGLDLFWCPLYVYLSAWPYPAGENHPTKANANYPYLLSNF